MEKQTGQVEVQDIIRQGDVLLCRVDSIPEGAVPVKGQILQQSETTGHHHHFKPTSTVSIYETKEPSGLVASITPDAGKYFTIKQDEFLYHGKGFEEKPANTKTGDHDAILLKAGTYQVNIVQVYDYDMKAPARVVD